VTADWSVRRHRARPRALGATRAAAIGLGVVGLGAATLTVTNALGVHTAADRTPMTPVWDVPADVMTAPPAAPARAAIPTGGPTNIRIPTINVNTSLEALSLTPGGALAAPGFTDAGWYAAGTDPGDVGPAIIAGHYDGIKPGTTSVFYRLNQLKPGDSIQIQRNGTWLTFLVNSVQSFPQSNFPSALVYGPTPDAELRLITCGGSYDPSTGGYVDNVVVFATEKTK
jgi:Sortase domain